METCVFIVKATISTQLKFIVIESPCTAHHYAVDSACYLLWDARLNITLGNHNNVDHWCGYYLPTSAVMTSPQTFFFYLSSSYY